MCDVVLYNIIYITYVCVCALCIYIYVHTYTYVYITLIIIAQITRLTIIINCNFILCSAHSCLFHSPFNTVIKLIFHSTYTQLYTNYTQVMIAETFLSTFLSI